MRRVKCGRWTCPNCIIDKLTDVFAPAWAFWEGAADRAEFDNEAAWHNARTRKYDIRMTGPRATPGVVSMPGADGVSRIVWAPAGTFDGDGDTRRGGQLDDALLRDIRAMPLGPPGPSRAPNPDALIGAFQDNPPLIRAAALAAGFDIDISGRSYVVVGGCTPEQFRAFRRELRR